MNPFIVGRYSGPDYFCDRENETSRMINAFENQRDLTLISHRRLGKTGLIHQVFHSLIKNKQYVLFYIDLLHTASLQEFVNSTAKAILGTFDSGTMQLLRSFGKFVKGIRPKFTIDPLTGKPEVEIVITGEYSPETSLEEIFNYLGNQQKQIIIAFDEFQQIAHYKEKNTEALLRGHIQKASNTTFVFSGSQKHMLLSMFSDYNRPFYQSTEIISLEKIISSDYSKFIIANFSKATITINSETVNYVLSLTTGYTYYVQYLCNRLYSLNEKTITRQMVNDVFSSILIEQEVVFINYKNLLTEYQFNLIKAIAKENSIKHPTAFDFIQKHNLTSPSSVKTALKALINKEMIYKDNGAYIVYDVFFWRWLERI